MSALLDVTRGLLGTVIGVLELPILLYIGLVNSSYLLLVLLAAGGFVHHMRRIEHSGRQETVGSQFAPGVSILVPAHNEEAGIVASV